jgi:hypothetical protein
MEDKDMKYKQVLDKLKKTEPVLNGSEELTDRIMQKVEQTAPGTGRIRVMRISGILSGVAASALICLLAYETLKYPVSPVENLSGTKPAVAVESIYSHNLGELNNNEKAEIFKNILKSREEQRIRKEQLNVSVMVSHRATNSF